MNLWKKDKKLKTMYKKKKPLFKHFLNISDYIFNQAKMIDIPNVMFITKLKKSSLT